MTDMPKNIKINDDLSFKFQKEDGNQLFYKYINSLGFLLYLLPKDFNEKKFSGYIFLNGISSRIHRFSNLKYKKFCYDIESYMKRYA